MAFGEAEQKERDVLNATDVATLRQLLDLCLYFYLFSLDI